jgi:isopentenyl-diphosphate Delta-isomerase
MNLNVKGAEAQRQDERFDVVDANDVVVGQATRGEVHARGLLHRAVHVVVSNQAGEIFLQKRSLAKDTCPGCWASSCSGHVDSGEDYDAAAQRELAEEIGVVVASPPARWFRMEPSEDTGWEFVWVYRMTGEGPFALNPAEVESGQWLAPAAITAAIAARPAEFAPAFRLLWTRALGQPGGLRSVARE